MPGRDFGELEARLVSPEWMPGVVASYFEALNAADLETLAGLFAPDAELRAVGARSRVGRDEVMTYFRSLFDPWPRHRDVPTRALVADAVVMVEVSFSGTSKTGKEIDFEAVDVFDLHGGTISRLTTWYDLAWVRRQL